MTNYFSFTKPTIKANITWFEYFKTTGVLPGTKRQSFSFLQNNDSNENKNDYVISQFTQEFSVLIYQTIEICCF